MRVQCFGLGFCLLSCLASVVVGQTVVPARGIAPVMTLRPATAVSTLNVTPAAPIDSTSSLTVEVGAAAEAARAAPSVAQTKLFEALQKLKFDRRPSMILRTWAELRVASPEPTASAQSEPKPDDAAAVATTTAATPTSGPKVDAPPQPWTAAKIASIAAQKAAAMQKQAAEDAEQFGRWITVGKWREASEILRQLPVDQQWTVYRGMLQQFVQVQREYQQLAAVDGMVEGGLNNQLYFEKHRFTLEDIEGLLSLAPQNLKRTDLSLLGQIAAGILESGISEQALHQEIEKRVAATPDSDRVKLSKNESEGADSDAAPATKKTEVAKPFQALLTKRQAAWLLLYAGQLEAAGNYLPAVEVCVSNEDAEGLNLIARLILAKSPEEAPDRVAEAWKVLQIVMASDHVSDADRNEALLRSVLLVPKLEEGVGQQWLRTLFQEQESKSREIMAVMGERVSRGMQTLPHSPDSRAESLEMMKIAAQVLLETRQELTSDWSELIDLLAASWLREAKFSQSYDTSTSLGPQLQRDQYGNFYYYDPYQYMRQPQNSSQRPTAISVEKVLKTIPEGKWFQAIDESLKPEVSMVCANLLLKVNEEEKAFPYIESLVATHPEKAQELAEQFLRVWTSNHDMNSSRGNNRYSPYYYAYGFNQAAESIPLTRSKQERNIKDLTRWVSALRELPGIEVDQELLANAFTTCHSGAEVYRFEEIETVFGPMQDIDPDVLAALSERMRTNLSGQWQIPDLQKQNNTKRNKNDIIQHVLDGYVLAMATLDKAIARHPDNWRLKLQRACLLFDDNEYRSVLQNRNEYSQQKLASYAEFGRAASAYASFAKDAKPSEYSVDVYEKWFYAMLGATNLERVTAESAAETEQTQRILDAIRSLGDPLSEEHLKRFSNVVVTRVGMANPGVKFTFLTEGFRITGDRPEVTQAKRLHEYYRDLVTELQLEAVVDGDDVISASQPFGVFVRINHTPEIERESGGFSRFLQNQSSLGYSYNYGRPPADYRDRFEEAARKALEEHFEVLSVTFQAETVKSQPLVKTGLPGWKTTPYAYLLLKARHDAVDRLPALKMDLDFLDTTGYIVLPIRTAELPLKVSDSPVLRPFQDLKVAQTLDQREGQKGKLSLEVKASCIGLVPELDQILDLKPGEFEVVKVEDSQPMVNSFDKDSQVMQVLTQRTWDIELKGRQDLNSRPDEFQFATQQEGVEFAEWSTMGFQDEDVVAMDPVVVLEGDYGKAATPWTAIITFASAALLGVVVLSLLVVSATGGKSEATDRRNAEELSPFALIAALSSKLESGSLSRQEEAELREEVHRLEQSYFGERQSSDSDSGQKGKQLKSIATKWL